MILPPFTVSLEGVDHTVTGEYTPAQPAIPGNPSWPATFETHDIVPDRELFAHHFAVIYSRAMEVVKEMEEATR